MKTLHLQKKIKRNNFNIPLIFNNSIFIFIVCPFMAYECLINFMPFALYFSLIFGSILFSMSLLFLIVPMVKTIFIFNNIFSYFFSLRIHKQEIMRHKKFITIGIQSL